MEDNMIKEYKDKESIDEIIEEPGTPLKPLGVNKVDKKNNKCKC